METESRWGSPPAKSHVLLKIALDRFESLFRFREGESKGWTRNVQINP